LAAALLGFFLVAAIGPQPAVPASHVDRAESNSSDVATLPGGDVTMSETNLPDCGPIEMGSGAGGDADPDAPTASCKVPETDIGVPNPVQKHAVPLESTHPAP
jgi:hypothetical protein